MFQLPVVNCKSLSRQLYFYRSSQFVCGIIYHFGIKAQTTIFDCIKYFIVICRWPHECEFVNWNTFALSITSSGETYTLYSRELASLDCNSYIEHMYSIKRNNHSIVILLLPRAKKKFATLLRIAASPKL